MDNRTPKEIEQDEQRSARRTDLWDEAVGFLRETFPKKTKDDIRVLIQNDPETWYAPHHFFWGMGVRNLLRRNGFGEGAFGITNLDNIYVPLVEEAVE